MTKTTEQILGADGVLARRPGFDHRPGQTALGELVARVFEDGGVALAEAETGIGKTLAWLIPAVLHPGLVVASTATRALQGQIQDKDAPLVADLLGMPVSIVVLKGRSNYLCLHRLDAVRQAPVDPVHRGRIEAVLRWAGETELGDRAEVSALPEDHPLWERLTVNSEACLGGRCPSYERCFVTRARARAERADVVVVNHHLYFADLAVRAAGGSVLPDHDTAVFDEAHALPEIAAPYFGSTIGSTRVDRWVRDARAVDDALATATAAVEGTARALFQALRPNQGREAWDPLADGGPVQDLQHALDDAIAFAIDELTRLIMSRDEGSELATLVRRATAIRGDLDRFFTPETGDSSVYYRESRGKATRLSMQPVEPANALHDSLFDVLRAAVLTSATLRSGGNFDFALTRLGLPPETETHTFSSPFDYTKQARLYLPEGLPPPAHPRFPNAIAAQVRALTQLTQGRAFVLFTSHRNLNAVHALLRGNFPFPLLRQGDAPRDHLLAQFRTVPGAVLLATQSFWEGVDVVGEALSLVIIDKLPFAPPDDPVLQARAAALKAAGGDPFKQLTLPSAALALRQGFGRLVRSPDDRGIVAVLDARLTQRGYGKVILRSLPPAPVVRDLATLTDWWTAD